MVTEREGETYEWTMSTMTIYIITESLIFLIDLSERDLHICWFEASYDLYVSTDASPRKDTRHTLIDLQKEFSVSQIKKAYEDRTHHETPKRPSEFPKPVTT